MSRTNHGGPKLPSALLDKIGSSHSNDTSNVRSRKRSQPLGRKEQRKALRQQKKQQRPSQRPPIQSRNTAFEEDHETNDDESDEVQTVPQPVQSWEKPANAPKSIVKRKNSRDVESMSPDRATAPPVSRAVMAKLEEDDAEIAALEKKLGLKGKKKLSKVLDDDGLGDLLDGLDDLVDRTSGKRKRSRSEYDEFLSSKRRHVEGLEYASDDESDLVEEGFLEEDKSDVGGNNDEDEDIDLHDGRSLGWSTVQEEEEFGGFDDDLDIESDSENSVADNVSEDVAFEDDEEQQPLPKQRENPYVAPAASSTESVGKYVPPSMRGAPASEAEEMTRLRRQLLGLLNRLSEANMISILHDIEAIYASNARQYVTKIFIDLLMGLLCDRTALMDTFIILHAGFAVATYKVIGAQFGAQLLERIVLDFDRLYGAEKDSAANSKEPANLVALLAELYTFQLVGSNLIFDYIRLFLADLNDLNTELLLKIIKNCGSQLRHDDPSSLKDIVILLQKSVAKAGEANLSVRTKFMIETINDLKNNRQKAGAAASSVAAEHTARMKKTLGTLNARAKASEPLGVSVIDIKSSSKEGKWWLVGASWKNEVQKPSTTPEVARDVEEDSHESYHRENTVGDDSADLLQLAKEQRMNTDIRRAILINIMSASDYKDAHMRLTKLKLKKAQELEIPRVLIHCTSAEQGYNPYYTLIAKRLCTEHRF
jgi:nucleolar MIF4G domain-containing protein 1